MRNPAIYHVAARTVELRDAGIRELQEGEIRIQAWLSAISAGTEGRLFRGDIPEGSPLDETLSSLGGEFRYPFRYGYALVGEVVETGAEVGACWRGRTVFAFHPHQQYAVAPVRECVVLPEGFEVERALFLANMETALGLVCDALPMVGERAMVFGQGVVGLLTVGVLGRYPLAELVSADPVAERRDFSRQFGAHLAVDPSDPRELAVLEDCLFHGGLNGLDIAIEVSGQTEALNRAIDLTGCDGRIVIGSWYGATGARVDLGERFHRRRLRLISSQVSSLSPVLSGRWSKFRRLELAVEWLNRLAPERLVTHRFPLSACQQAFEAVANYATGATQVLIEYP